MIIGSILQKDMRVRIGIKYIANLTDYLEVNDLTVKGSYTFYKDYLRFTAKTAINNLFDPVMGGTSLTSFSNYQLDIRFSPMSNLTITQLGNGAIRSEGEFNLWQDDTKDHNVSLYKECNVDENALISSTVQLLYNFRNTYLINFGIRGQELYSHTNRRLNTGLFSLGGVARLYQDTYFTTWGGVHVNLKPNSVDNVSVLLGLSNATLNGIVRFNIEKRDLTTAETTFPLETKIISNERMTTTTTTSIITEPYYYENEVRLGLESKLQDGFLIFSTLSVKKDKTPNILTKFIAGGMYNIDTTTNLRFKMTDDMVTTLSLTKRIRNLLDFTFASSFTYSKPVSEKNMGNIKTKFGLSLIFLDETLV
jgi:hypothetical protein